MRNLTYVVVALAITAAACGVTPKSKPAEGSLPPGHPDVSQPRPAGVPQGQMPAGHPDISGMKGKGAPQGQMPAGHPDIKQLMEQAKQKGMPAGHPPMPGMPGADVAAAPTTQPASPTLFIQAEQGTVGGPQIAGDPVTVELYHQGKIIGKIEKTLDAQGKVTIADLPANVEYQPVIRVKHAGVDFVAPASPMGPGHPAGQTVRQRVFEVTDQQPDFRIKIRHLMITPFSDAVKVMEVLNIENPTDRAWTGKTGADGKKETFALQLPKGAKDVRVFTGFDECCRMDGERIVNTLPLMPEVAQYQLQYTVPAVEGKVDLSIVSPANVDRTTVFVPEDGSEIAATGLEVMPARNTERGGKTRYLKSQSTKAGEVATITLSNLPAGTSADAHTHGPGCQHGEQAAPGTAVEVAGMTGSGKIYVGAALALIVFLGVGFMFKPSAKKA